MIQETLENSDWLLPDNISYYYRTINSKWYNISSRQSVCTVATLPVWPSYIYNKDKNCKQTDLLNMYNLVVLFHNYLMYAIFINIYVQKQKTGLLHINDKQRKSTNLGITIPGRSWDKCDQINITQAKKHRLRHMETKIGNLW
jgi:hypothetical protein